MTADENTENLGQDQGSTGKSRGRKASRKRGTTTPAKRSRTSAASSRSGGSRSTSESQGRGTKRAARSGRSSGQGSSATASRSRSTRSSGRTGSSSSGSGSSRSGIASRLLSGMGRAIPLAARSMPDQRVVQRLADERPYMLGALGLGIGAMIGMMLPGTLSSMRGRSTSGRGRSRD